jgi:hypothetical protein
MNSIISKLILIAALFTLQSNLLAQTDTSLTINAVFEGNRRLFLRDANKISIWPQTKDSVVQMTSITYTTLPTPKAVTIEPKLIPAAKINVEEKLGYLYRGYIKAGYGTYNTLPIDFYYTDGRSKKGTFGVHYQLLRGDGVALDDKDSIPDRYSDNRSEIWGKWFFKKTQLLGKANWERNITHWYGVDVKNDYKGPSFDSLTFNQRMNTFGGGLSFLTYQRDTGDFNFNADMYLRNTKDIKNNGETNFDILLHGRTLKDSTLYSIDFGVNYNNFNFAGPQLDGTNIDLASIAYDVDDVEFRKRSWDNAIIKFVPTASTTWKGLRAKVGAGIYIEGRGSNPGHFYPLAELSYNLLKGVIVPYAGLRGSTEPTTYLSLYRENPFIQSFPKLKNKNNKLDAYLGIGGAVSSAVSYSVGFNYQEFGNFNYFINDSISYPSAEYYTYGNVFHVIYDDLNVYNFHGEMAIYAGEKWKANIRGDYFSYKTGLESHAWHQPNLKLLANAQYNLKSKFILGTDLFYIGARWAKSTVPVKGVEPTIDGIYTSYIYKLKGFLDANFKVEYRYNKRLSAWVQFNNAFALKYQRWGGYNNQQFLAMMGATYAF